MEQINRDNFESLISREDIQRRIGEMALQIDHDYAGEDVLLICILSGAVVFTVDLMMQMQTPAQIDFMKVSSYEGTNSSGVLKVDLDLKKPVTGRNVIICEDIIDTGFTLSYLKDYLLKQDPKSLKIAVFADKKERRIQEVEVDYTGFEIPDKFVIGYGLDYEQVGRNIPYLGYVVDPGKDILKRTRTNNKDKSC